MKKIGKILTVAKISLKKIKGRTLAVDAMNQIVRINSAAKKYGFSFTKKWVEFVVSLREWFRPIFVFEGAQDPRKGYSKPTMDLMPLCKQILVWLRTPWMEAPADGEAQAAYLQKKNIAWGVMSTDYDAILYGAKILVRKIDFSSKIAYIINVDDTLKSLSITYLDMLKIAILTGTSIFPAQMGLKTALKKFKEVNIPDNMLEEYLSPIVLEPPAFSWGFPSLVEIKNLEQYGLSKKQIQNIYSRLLRAETLFRTRLL